MLIGAKGNIQWAITIGGYKEANYENATFHGLLTCISILTDGTNDVKIDLYNTGALSAKSAAKMIYTREVAAGVLAVFDNFVSPFFIDATVADPGFSVEITTTGGAGCGFLLGGANFTVSDITE